MKKSIIVLLVLLVIIVIIGVGFVTYKIGENKGKEDKQGMNEKSSVNTIVNEIDNTNTNQNTTSNEVNNNIIQNNTLSKVNNNTSLNTSSNGTNTQTSNTLEIGRTFKYEDSQGGSKFTLLAGNIVKKEDWQIQSEGFITYGTYEIENNKLIITCLGDWTGTLDEPYIYDEPRIFTYTITGYNKCEREYNGSTLVYKAE